MGIKWDGAGSESLIVADRLLTSTSEGWEEEEGEKDAEKSERPVVEKTLQGVIKTDTP